MADRIDRLADTDLEAALRDLGGRLAVPEIALAGANDPAARALRRIVDGAGMAPRRRWSWPAPTPGRRVVRGLALALVAVIGVAAVAGAIGLGLPGIRIVLPPTTSTPSPIASAIGSPGPTARPTPSPSLVQTPRATITDPLGGNLALGTPVAFADAPNAVDIPVVLPTAPGVGAPATAWLLDGRLSFVWRASSTLPTTLEPGVGLLVSEFRGSIAPGYFEKILDQGTTIAAVSIDGSPGYWIAGAPHEFVYVSPSGNPVFDSRRSVGDTLVWARGDVTYRIESALGRDATIALAETMR